MKTRGRTKKKAVGDDTEARKRRDFDAVHYMGVHNRSGGGRGEKSPSPGNSSTDENAAYSVWCLTAYLVHRSCNVVMCTRTC